MSISPLHVGAYEYQGEGLNGIVELDWNGWTWGVWSRSKGGLPVRIGYRPSSNDSWRGLAERP